ncbi:hypothetical protein EYC84_002467 [Monilinia fructicola]|uniref:Protein kinase domain-containing protein n=1 Tax=Monilinia fructicola TaxID=38448 RepID=A0A5M9JQP2_MONFR|nr:hypothetical protein EYC84_002467 [Monilinia fructicola]
MHLNARESREIVLALELFWKDTWTSNSISQPGLRPSTATTKQQYNPQQTAHSTIFSTAPPRKPPPEQPSPSDWESYTLPSANRKQTETWLRLSETWDQWPGFASTWEGVRHLGKGGAGSADLFRKIGCAEDTEGMPAYVVVKQAERSDEDLLRESVLLQLFVERKTPHVLRIYRGYHEGEGVPPRNTGGMFEVGRENFRNRQKRVASRIYLEFCEKGDLERWTTEYIEKDGIVIEEKVIWDMFECLARACMMLEHGFEASEARGGQRWIPMCHLDLKPANILISNKDSNHDEIGIFKMADFGLSAHVPRDPQDPGWLAHVADHMTVGWGAPEQFFPQMSNRSYSTPANVFRDSCNRLLCDDEAANSDWPGHGRDNYSTSVPRGDFVLANLLEQYTYESSQPVTNYWPERGAVPRGIPGYEDSKDLLKYYPTHQSIAAAKEREERFLESFWVTAPEISAASSVAFGNPFSSGTDLDSSSSTFSFGEQSSTFQSSDSVPFKSDNNPSGSSNSGGGFIFGK